MVFFSFPLNSRVIKMARLAKKIHRVNTRQMRSGKHPIGRPAGSQVPAVMTALPEGFAAEGA